MVDIQFLNESYELSSNSIVDQSVDLFFCDPPYYISGAKQNDDMNLTSGVRNDWDRQWNSKEDFYKWTKEWMSLAYQQMKETASMYVCISWQHSGAFQKILEEIGFIIRNRITWKRDKGRGSDSNWKSMHEDIWFVTKTNKFTFNIQDVKIKRKVIAPYRDENGDPKDWFVDDNGEKVRYTSPGNLWDEFVVPFWSMLEVRSYTSDEEDGKPKLNKHNTQKPKNLVKRCILASSNKNDLVVDYFFGSGTTGIACKELSRNFIGFDINKDNLRMAKLRIKNEIDERDKNLEIMDELFEFRQNKRDS